MFDALYGAGCEIADHRIPVERRRVVKTNLRTHNKQFYAVAWSDMSSRSPTIYGFTSTPIGKALLVGSGPALTGLYMADHAHTPAVPESWLPDRGQLDGVRGQLDEYFTGARTGFDVITRPAGTPFQRAVWLILEAIPYGTTITYGEIAGRLGRPRAARAVGAANGQNPISIVIPCHRVIGSSGGLTGYGWGLERKAWLLRHEREHSALTGS